MNLLYSTPSVFNGQDFVHGGKKLRNQLRALTTRYLLFGSPKKSSSAANWGIIWKFWCDNPDMRLICIKSAIDYKDRQDPSLVYEVTKLHSIITGKKGQNFPSLYILRL